MPAPHADENPLSSYRWENRLIILYFPDTKDARASLKELERSIRLKKSAIQDRDLLLFHVGPIPNRRKASYATGLSEADQSAIRQRLGLDGDEAQLVLLGKDGGVKQRQTQRSFALERMFTLIDTMPMRQQEMRERGK